MIPARQLIALQFLLQWGLHSFEKRLLLPRKFNWLLSLMHWMTLVFLMSVSESSKPVGGSGTFSSKSRLMLVFVVEFGVCFLKRLGFTDFWALIVGHPRDKRPVHLSKAPSERNCETFGRSDWTVLPHGLAEMDGASGGHWQCLGNVMFTWPLNGRLKNLVWWRV